MGDLKFRDRKMLIHGHRAHLGIEFCSANAVLFPLQQWLKTRVLGLDSMFSLSNTIKEIVDPTFKRQNIALENMDF